MPRPRAALPKHEQVLIRLTQQQMRVLQSVGHLNGLTASKYVFDVLTGHLKQMERDPLVQADLANRVAYESRSGRVVALRATNDGGAASVVPPS